MDSPRTRRAWSGSMMARFGCGTQVSPSETPTSRTESAQRDSPAPSRLAAARASFDRHAASIYILLARERAVASQRSLHGGGRTMEVTA